MINNCAIASNWMNRRKTSANCFDLKLISIEMFDKSENCSNLLLIILLILQIAQFTLTSGLMLNQGRNADTKNSGVEFDANVGKIGFSCSMFQAPS